MCGGTIIASKYIVTAAHCFSLENDDKITTKILTAKEVTVWIGDHNLAITGETKLPEIRIRNKGNVQLF